MFGVMMQGIALVKTRHLYLEEPLGTFQLGIHLTSKILHPF